MQQSKTITLQIDITYSSRIQTRNLLHEFANKFSNEETLTYITDNNENDLTALKIEHSDGRLRKLAQQKLKELKKAQENVQKN